MSSEVTMKVPLRVVLDSAREDNTANTQVTATYLPAKNPLTMKVPLRILNSARENSTQCTHEQ